MDLKLNLYEDRLCRRVKTTLVANEFGLSTAICEDVIKIINPESFATLKTLSTESQLEIISELIKEGYPFFMELIKEIFEVNDDDGYYSVEDIGVVIVQIYYFAMAQLGKAVGKLNRKN